MLKRIVLLIIVALASVTALGSYVHLSHGIIWIEGHITEDTTWKPLDTYRVIGDTYVDPSITLTIEPGVLVQFADGFSLFVDGSLNAIGTETETITFTSSRSSPSPGAWRTIHFRGNSSEWLFIKHARIEYAVHGVTIESSGLGTIEKNEISNCSESGIVLAGEVNVVISENSLRQNRNGIASHPSDVQSGVAIVNNTISTSQENGIMIGAYSHQSSCLYNITILSNTILYSGEDGVGLESLGSYAADFSYIHSVTIASNVVLSSEGNGIRLYGYNEGDYSYIHNITVSTNNVVSTGSCGIFLDNHGGEGSVHDVVVSSNNVSHTGSVGIFFFGKRSIHDSDILSNTVLSANSNGIYLDCPIGSVHNVTIVSNMILSCKDNGIVLHSSAHDFRQTQIADIALSSNTILECQSNGIFLNIDGQYGHILNNALSSNAILKCGGNGIHLQSAPWHKRGFIYNISISFDIISSNVGNGVYISASRNQTEYDVHISNCEISDNSQNGVEIKGGTNANLTRNSISYNLHGIHFLQSSYTYATSQINLANFNDIYYNSYGVNVTNGAIVDAENNYWGDTDGPYHQSLNPEGTGNPVNGDGTDLDFIPFLTSPVGTINQRPEAILEVNKANPNVDETVTFDATSSTDDGRIDYYFFDFGDGTNSSWTALPVVTHAYAEEEAYNATLIVMDDFGVMSLDGDFVYVEITVIPEFPSLLILPLFMIAAFLIVTLSKRSNRIKRV